MLVLFPIHACPAFTLADFDFGLVGAVTAGVVEGPACDVDDTGLPAFVSVSPSWRASDPDLTTRSIAPSSSGSTEFSRLLTLITSTPSYYPQPARPTSLVESPACMGSAAARAAWE